MYTERQKSFQETQTSFPKCIKHLIFLNPQLQLLRLFGYRLTIQSLTSRKRYAQKTYGCDTAFIIHRQEHPLKISSQHVVSVFQINGQF